MKRTTVPIPSSRSKKQGSPAARKSRDSIWSQDIEFGPALPTKLKAAIYTQWGTLLKAGLSMVDAMEILIEGQQKKKSREILEYLNSSLTQGGALSVAMGTRENYFSAFEIATIKTGETTGNLGGVLARLGSLYEKRVRLSKKVRQAMSYPIVVIVLALVVLGFMMSFVVPMFEDVFNRFDRPLPEVTKWVLSVSAAIRQNGGWVLLVLAIGGFIFWQLRKREKVATFLSAALLKIPLLGPVLFQLDLARTTYSLGLLLVARVNLDQALEVSAAGTRFPALQACLLRLRQAIVDGRSLTEASKEETILPLTLRQLIRVGEKTAKLPQIIESYAEQAEEEAESKVQLMTQLLEPALIVVLGAMVAVILVAMYLPMFSLSQAFG